MELVPIEKVTVVLRLFGYGSLLFSPERAEHVVERIPARLHGHRRSFNKLSNSRFCPRAESHDAFDPPHECFVRAGEHRSLVLGTEPDEKGLMEGMVLVYAESVRDEVLRLTDAREGYASDVPPPENAYERVECVVVETATGRDLACETYLTNPHPDCVWRAPPLSVEARARAMVNATPRVRAGETDSRGLHYLEGVRAQLRTLGVVDPELEHFAETVRALAGPWTELIAPAR